MQALLKHAVDFILPPRCVVSGDVVDRQGMLAPHIWQSFRFIGDPQCKSCGLPFDYDVDGDTICAGCMAYPPRYDAARSALVYDDASRDVILRFKHADAPHAVRAFVPWLQSAAPNLVEEADIITAVPLHYRRYISRRYNQSAILAQGLAQASGSICIPDLLLRTRATPPQGHLKPKARRDNVKKAFAINKRFAEQIKGKRILIMDDVYTTGATVNECAKVLKKAGASCVDVLTVARVVK